MNVCKDNCLAECIQCEPMKLNRFTNGWFRLQVRCAPSLGRGCPSTIQVGYINEYKSIS